MYPNRLFFDLTLYDILICVGIIFCFIVFGFLADKRKIKVSLQKVALLCGCFAIPVGFFFAALFQAIYNIPTKGGFEFLFKIVDGKIVPVSSGITFYGGLLGGAAVFLILYFTVGYLHYKKSDNVRYHNENFFSMASAGAASIAIAHSLGRFGCLMAGCCHGAETDAWYGIWMWERIDGQWVYEKFVPTQLFEAIFLLLLFVFLFINAYRGKRYNLPIYMASYGIWRFIIEFFRADYRGSIGIDAITPSQFIAILMILGAVGVFFLERTYTNNVEKRNAEAARFAGEEDTAQEQSSQNSN